MTYFALILSIPQANLKNWGEVLKVLQQCPSKDFQVGSLAKVLTVHAEQQHPELKDDDEP